MYQDEIIFLDSCTFIQTGRTFVEQELYVCNTCEFRVNDQVICAICAKTCHANHNVTRWTCRCINFRRFCDCGAGDFGTCNAPSDNLTPLHLAATGGHLNILKFKGKWKFRNDFLIGQMEPKLNVKISSFL